jgi:hypothetical protein
MNCKQGEMAIVTRSEFGNNGRIVTCLRLASKKDMLNHFGFFDTSQVWVTDSTTLWSNYGELFLAKDCILTPLRGDLTTDTIETPIKEIA